MHSYIKLALGVQSHVIRITNIECTPIWSLSETNALQCGPFCFKKCTPIWSLSLFEVQSHVVPNKLWNALPCGPFCFLGCTPMCSVTIFGVHSDLVLITFENALRSGPPLYMMNSPKSGYTVYDITRPLKLNKHLRLRDSKYANLNPINIDFVIC